MLVMYEPHQLMDCDHFKGKTTDERKDLSNLKDSERIFKRS